MLKLRNPIAGLASDFTGVAGSALVRGFIADFVRSESGEVDPKQGLPVAWTGGLLIAAMVILGSPPQAAASCGWTVRCVHDAMCLQYCMVHLGCAWGECFGRKCYCLP